MSSTNKTPILLHNLPTAVKKITKRIFNFFIENHPYLKDRLCRYIILARIDKPIGIFLLLWPTLWALWIAAQGYPDLHILLIFIFGVILMRSAGCVINDLADRNIDRHIKRTRNRAIASGQVQPSEALSLAVAMFCYAFILALFLNKITFILSFVAIILAIIYPFMKRYTYLPQFFLGLAFSWSIPMAFAAQTQHIPHIAWLLFITAVLWTVVYDTMYAMADRQDDLRAGVKSTAILFDESDLFIIAFIQIMVLSGLLLIGNKIGLGNIYRTSVAVAALFFIYQQYLIRNRDSESCLKGFFNNNWFGATIFIGIYLDYL